MYNFRGMCCNTNLLYYFTLLWAVQAVFCDDSSARRDLNFLDLAKYDGYEAEQHFVTTEDGYILGLFRLPLKANCSESKGVIMFMHGLYLSSDDCLIPGPGKAHCYVYSDSCYEVWAPNIRGNIYSRNHTQLNPDRNSQFWDFSIDEMAMYDLPAVIDYVLKETDETQLSYVAHSQGVALLVLLCAKVPEYNEKIKIGIGLSATAWLENAKFIAIQLQGLSEYLLSLAGGLLNMEILPRNGIVNLSAEVLCGLSNLSYAICSNIIFTVLGYNEYQITSDILPVVVGHIPSGTSLKNFNRWGQMKNNGFSEYDYGAIKNLFVYGQITPPLFDLSKVTMKWVIVGSLNDYVGDVRDVRTLTSNLSNSSLCVLSDNTFGHLDFIYGKDIPNYITPIVLSSIETGTYECT